LRGVSRAVIGPLELALETRGIPWLFTIVSPATAVRARLKAGLKEWAIPAVLGVLAFFGVTGGRLLAPRNIAWLGNGDPATYFIGWHYFRNTPWGFPLGANPRYGAELGSAIAYADILPLFAFPFKLVTRWLPDTFQYFGFWILCCFVLQACFAWLLVGLLTEARFARSCGSALFVFAPPFLWRLSGHYQMLGQWLVLAALYLCFGPRERTRGVAWPLLAFTVSLVHSYLTAMVLGLWLADWLRRVLFEGRKRADFVQLLAVPALVLLAEWQAGLFMVGHGILTEGFGEYRMNLASLVDSDGWSYLLKDIQGPERDYEGFNYLGLGLILLVVAVLPTLKGALPALFEKRHYWPLLTMLSAFAAFAISNHVGFANHDFVIPLPQAAIDAAQILRSSGRMFWPTFYVILWVVVRALLERYPPRVAAALLFVAVCVQAVDTSAGWRPIRRDLLIAGKTWPSPLKSPFWARVPANYDEIRMLPPGNVEQDYAVFAYFAATHGMSSDAIYLARVDSSKLERADRQARWAVIKAKYARRTLYIVSPRYENAARHSVRDSALFAKIDGFYLLAPDWKCRPECAASAGSAPDCSARCR
jgi:hypothetical protein